MQKDKVNKTNKYNSSNAISLENFSVDYLNSKEKLLKDINYTFERGKIHYIVGPPGCGKTTLISHFNGLLKPSGGIVKIDDKPIVFKGKKLKKVSEIRKQVGIVFQFAEYQLFKPTILKDIIFGPLNFGIKKNDAIQLAIKYIRQVGMSEEFFPRSPFGLSGGQKRRVAIAGILAIEPDVLIFDEPGAGLDPKGEEDIMNIMLSLKKQNKTIIIVSHTVNNVMQIADNIVVINNGGIVKTGTPYEIFTDDNILKDNHLSKPVVIDYIQQLVNNNAKFKKLYDMKPRTIDELANCINNIADE